MPVRHCRRRWRRRRHHHHHRADSIEQKRSKLNGDDLFIHSSIPSFLLLFPSPPNHRSRKIDRWNWKNEITCIRFDAEFLFPSTSLSSLPVRLMQDGASLKRFLGNFRYNSQSKHRIIWFSLQIEGPWNLPEQFSTTTINKLIKWREKNSKKANDKRDWERKKKKKNTSQSN